MVGNWYLKMALGFCLMICLSSVVLADPRQMTEGTNPSDALKIPYTVVEVHPGDHCTVSGKPLDPKKDICLLISGRRVPLKKEALKIFLENPEKYFARVQPKGALFTEEMKTSGQLALGWFFLGLYVMLGLIFAALTAHTAVTKGISPTPWFFAGLLANAFGYLILLTKKSKGGAGIPKGLRKVPTTMQPIICSECGNENHPSAKRCLGCGRPLLSQSESEVDRAL